MNHLDLFAGIGGFSLAASWMGWETVAQVEWDAWCQKILAKNFPNALRFGDIVEFNKMLENGEITTDTRLFGQTFNEEQTTGIEQYSKGGNRLGRIDIITGGFPCQPFSHAGKRKGTDDSRYLWPEMLETIRRIKPSYVVGENVAGLVSMENGKTLDRILSDLEDEGYTTERVIIPACAVGAWHRRDRIWIIAQNTRGNGCRNGEYDKQGHIGNIRQSMPGSEERNIREETFDVSDTISGGQSGQGQYEQPVDPKENRNRQAVKSWAGGISDQWGVEPHLGMLVDGLPPGLVRWDREPEGVPRVATGVKDRVNRLKGLGNAIVPQVAYEVFKAIEQYELSLPHVHQPNRDK